MVRQADNLYTKAEQAIKRRNFDYAVELLLQGLQLDPLNIEQRKRLHQTEILAVQEKGGNPKGDFKTGFGSLGTQWKIKKLGMSKKWEEQIIEIEKVLKKAPQHTSTLFTLANAFEHLDNGKEAAIAVYQNVVEADRTQIEAWRALGKLYSANDPQKAIECWEKVKQYKPDDKEAGKAIRDLSAATMVKNAEDRKKGGKGDFHDLLADEDESKKLEEDHQIIRTEEDARKAIKRITEKLKSTPEDKRLTRQLGDMYRRVKEYEQAEKIYLNLLDKDPNDLLAQERLGDLKEQKFADRVEEITERCKADPADAALKAELKKAKEEQDDFLVVELERRVKAHPTDCGLKAKYGALLIRKNKVDEAVEQFQKALQDPRFSTQSHANLGRCFNLKGLYDLAVDEFGKALKQISDQNSTIWKDINYSLAETYAHKKDWDTARSTMEKILAVDIKFRDVSQKVQEYREQIG